VQQVDERCGKYRGCAHRRTIIGFRQSASDDESCAVSEVPFLAAVWHAAALSAAACSLPSRVRLHKIRNWKYLHRVGRFPERYRWRWLQPFKDNHSNSRSPNSLKVEKLGRLETGGRRETDRAITRLAGVG
jgi:hypothetical protein